MTARRAERENGGLGEDPPGRSMTGFLREGSPWPSYESTFLGPLVWTFFPGVALPLSLSGVRMASPSSAFDLQTTRRLMEDQKMVRLVGFVPFTTWSDDGICLIAILFSKHSSKIQWNKAHSWVKLQEWHRYRCYVNLFVCPVHYWKLTSPWSYWELHRKAVQEKEKKKNNQKKTHEFILFRRWVITRPWWN